jgi:hypothetical protein
MIGAMLVACGASGQSTEKPWQYSASVSYYDVPHSQDYWNPIVTADRGRVHLEARYNYLSIDSGSFWAGANFSTGKTWIFDVTVMAGIVVGSVQGLAPGYELSLRRSWFTLSSQGEYVFDMQEEVDDLFYNWMELTGSPARWCRLGFALQQTNAPTATRDVQRGVVAAFSYKKYDIEVDVLDPDRDDATYILSLTIAF